MDIPGMLETAKPIADRVRAQGAGRDRRVHRRPDADRLRIEPRHKGDRAAEGRADDHPLHRLDHHRRAQHHPGGRDPRLLRRRDDVVRRARRRPRHRGRRRVGRAAVELRGGGVHPRAASVQGRRLRRRRRRRGNGADARPLQHDDRHAGQRADVRRQREDHERDDQELQQQSVPPRRPHGAARPQRRSRRRGATAEGGAAEDRERREESRARRRDPDVQRARARARRAALLQYRALLAGVLRHQPHDPRDVRRRRLSRRGGASCTSARRPCDRTTASHREVPLHRKRGDPWECSMV